MTENQEHHVDVAIVGGAFSGSAMALLLKRKMPDTKVLVIEKSTEFDRKVGESTSEVAGCFLTRILNLTGYLSRNHITKHGLRMWFTAEGNDCISHCTEMGSRFQSRLATFQLDRSHLDKHLLDLAEEENCELWRPATVRSAELASGGKNRLEVKREDGTTHMVNAKWVVDASGKAAWLARKFGYWKKLSDHPTNAVWARFRNVGDLDSGEARMKLGESATYAPRGTATNHLMGKGWWCWIIPLRDGDVSAGLVYDSRLFTPPEGGTLSERLQEHLTSHPVGKFLFADAVPVEKDTRTYKHLPYHSTQVSGDGWLSVGDAAGFMDPLYSQGLDYCAHSVYAGHKVILKSLKGECAAEDAKAYNDNFQLSYERWYQALYEDKYHYLGDAELVYIAFLLDLSTYFVGPVRLVYEDPDMEFSLMPYHGTIGKSVAKFMRFYNRRLVVLAKKKLANESYGRKNLDEKMMICGLSPDTDVLKVFNRGIRLWLRQELALIFVRLPKNSEEDAMREDSPVLAQPS